MTRFWPRAYALVTGSLRAGFFEALAYRAELLVWILTTGTPFIMLALFWSIAREAPLGDMDQRAFGVYFFVMFVVRQICSSWISWELNFEVRSGALNGRLLRPISPVWAYALENLAALPVRGLIAIPAITAGLIIFHDRLNIARPMYVIWFVCALWGGWLLTFAVHVLIGSLSFFIDSSIKVMDLWFVAIAVFGGYLYPVAIMPDSLHQIAQWLPFRYQLAPAVELMTRPHTAAAAWSLLAKQWSYAAVLGLGATAMWKAGIRRYGAFGG